MKRKGEDFMLSQSFTEAFDALIATYSERLTGDATPETIEMVKVMALYNYITKSMPPLSNHWNQVHPAAKEELKATFEKIKELNTAFRQKNPMD